MKIEIVRIVIIDENGITKSTTLDLRGRRPDDASSMRGLILESISLMERIESASDSGGKH